LKTAGKFILLSGLLILGLGLSLPQGQYDKSLFEELKSIKPLATQQQGDVKVSLLAVFREGYLTALPQFALQKEKGSTIYVLVEKKGSPFPSFSSGKEEHPYGVMHWQDDKGRKGASIPPFEFQTTKENFYARYVWQNLYFSPSAKYITVYFDFSIPSLKKYSFLFKNVKIPPQEETKGKPLAPPLQAGKKIKKKVDENGSIVSKEYTVIASQVQGDLRVSLFRISQSISPSYPVPRAKKGIEIGLIAEKLAGTLSIKPWPISALSWKDDKGTDSSKTHSTYYIFKRWFLNSAEGTSKVSSNLREGFEEVHIWTDFAFSKSAKKITIQYDVFIYPNRRYSFTFKDVALPNK